MTLKTSLIILLREALDCEAWKTVMLCAAELERIERGDNLDRELPTNEVQNVFYTKGAIKWT